jgi:NodT family efflux transporter outer membrane factor (OMF) lipoprotein
MHNKLKSKSHSGNRTFGTLFSILMLFLSGCAMVGPNYKPPKTNLSPDWMEITDPRLNKNFPGHRSWWEGFKDPVLNRLINLAYRQNLTLRQAGLRVLEARAQLAVTKGELLPQTQQISGALQTNRTSQRSLSDGFFSPNYGQSEVDFSASWEIDFWGKYRRAIESAKASWLATLDDYDNALVSLTADVANSYILIKTIEKRIEIAQQNVTVQKESLKIVEVRFQYGTTTQLDLEQAKTFLNNTLASIPVLVTQLQQTQNALSLLLGLPPANLKEILTGGKEIPVPPSQIAVGVPADLLRRRPDVRSAEHSAKSQAALVGVAEADLYPAFSLSGFFGFLATDVGASRVTDLYRWDSRTWQIGPSFQWKLFNYGRIKNNVRAQDARFEQLLTAYQNAVLKAQQEVENALAAFLRSKDQADFLAKSTEAAQKALHLAVLQYQEGTKDFTTVLVAQQALLNEQDSLTSTLGTTDINLVGVYRALGGGWEIREGQSLVPEEIRKKMARRTDWGGLLKSSEYIVRSSE